MFLVFVASVLRVFEFVSVFSFYIFSVFHAFRGRWNCLRVLVGISSVFPVFFKLSWSLPVFLLFSIFSSEIVSVFEIFSVFACFARLVELSSSSRRYF